MCVCVCVCRTSNTVTSLQSQLTALRENLGKLTGERDAAKRDLDAKNHDLQEKLKTITQVKKIGRRYKTQYEELKEEHDKVRPCCCCWWVVGDKAGCFP